MLQHSTEITEHGKSHASHKLKTDEDYYSAKEKLWNQLKSQNYQTQICLPCHRYFPNRRALFLHLIIFPHYLEKNICVSCRVCINDTMLNHTETHHLQDTTCPFACTIPLHLIGHHLLNQHRQIDHIIPRIELNQIRRNAEDLAFTERITGEYGTVTLDFHLELFIKSRSSLEYGLDLRKKYSFTDGAGWQICERILTSRKLRRNLRRAHSDEIKLNPMRFLTKIMLMAREGTACISRQENPEVIFQIPSVEKKKLCFSHGDQS